MGRYRETTQSSSWARSRKTPRQTVGSSSMNVVIADIRGSSRSNLGSLRLLTTCSRAGHCARQEPRNDPARSWNRCWRLCPRTKFDDLSRLGLIGTHERFPKALRYAKLNQLCHDPLLGPVSLGGQDHNQAPNPLETRNSMNENQTQSSQWTSSFKPERQQCRVVVPQFFLCPS